MTMIPQRLTNLSAAREKYHGRVDDLARYMMLGDPLADDVIALFNTLPPGQGRRMLQQALTGGIDSVEAAPEPLRALFEQLETVPFWVDSDTLDRGGTVVRRAGLFGAIALGCCSLPAAYAIPGGNRPLVFSGRLVRHAPRRLAETARFMSAICDPGGLNRFSEGFAITVRVRLMHAQVRYLLARSGRWDRDAWGEPISQADMAASNLLFSVAFLHGLRRLGFRFPPSEAEAVMQLWRYCGYLNGIQPQLLCVTEEEGRRLADLILATRGTADEHSRALTKALLEGAMLEIFFPGRNLSRLPGRRRISRFFYGLSYTLVGGQLARELDYPRTAWRFTACAIIRLCIAPAETLRRIIPGGASLAVRVWTGVMQWGLHRLLAGELPEFDLPRRLSRLSLRISRQTET